MKRDKDINYDSNEIRVGIIQNTSTTIRDLEIYVKKEGLDIKAGALTEVERALCERLTLELARGVFLPQKLLEAQLIYTCRAAVTEASEKKSRVAWRVLSRLGSTLNAGDQGLYAYCNEKAEFFRKATEEMEMTGVGFESTKESKELHHSLMNQYFSWEKMRDEYYIHGKPMPEELTQVGESAEKK